MSKCAQPGTRPSALSVILSNVLARPDTCDQFPGEERITFVAGFVIALAGFDGREVFQKIEDAPAQVDGGAHD